MAEEQSKNRPLPDLPIADCRLPIADSPIDDYQLSIAPSAFYRFPITHRHCRLPIWLPLPIADCPLPIDRASLRPRAALEILGRVRAALALVVRDARVRTEHARSN